MSTLTRSDTHTVHFAADPAQVGAARSWAVAVSGLDGELAKDLALVASELATNALVHTRSGLRDGAYTISVTRYPDCVRVCVLDGGPSVVPGSQRPPDEGGRGLALVAGVAHRWGADHEDGRTRVWAEIATPVPCPR